MLERAELIKFIYLISTKLQYNNLKFIFENAYVSLHPFKTKKSNDIRFDSNINDMSFTEAGPNKFFMNSYKDPKNTFKTKIVGKEFIKCDICGERAKIGTLTLYSYMHNIGGHWDHVIEYIKQINK
jgi:hypothetical protein